MKKVKNVIKGFMVQYDIEEITIFEGDKIHFSGKYKHFEETSANDPYLYEMKVRILNSECIKCLNFNNKKLFIFI